MPKPLRPDQVETTTSGSNKTTRGSATREAILDVALNMASQVGIEGLTIGSLAKEVGMSKSGLFAHFNSRDNLQLQVLERAAELFTQNVLRPAFREPRGEPRLLALFKNWIRFLNKSDSPGGSVFVAAAFELDDRPGLLRDYVERLQRDLITNLEKAVQIAKDAGHFSESSDPAQFAWTLYAFVLGFHHSRRMLEDPKAEDYARRAFEGLLETVRKKI